MYQKILIATDGSDFSKKCIEHGIELAKNNQAEVTIVTVTVPYSISGLTGGWLDSPSTMEEYEENCKKVAGDILSTAKEYAKSLGVNISTVHLSEVAPATAIVEIADNLGSDLVVMGSHGRRGIQRVLLGSQVNEVLQTCKVPVLVVR